MVSVDLLLTKSYTYTCVSCILELCLPYPILRSREAGWDISKVIWAICMSCFAARKFLPCINWPTKRTEIYTLSNTIAPNRNYYNTLSVRYNVLGGCPKLKKPGVQFSFFSVIRLEVASVLIFSSAAIFVTLHSSVLSPCYSINRWPINKRGPGI